MLYGDHNKFSPNIKVTGATDPASTDVVFACLSGGNCPGKFGLSFNLDMGSTFSIVSYTCSLHTFLFAFRVPLASLGFYLSAFYLYSILCALSRRGALSAFYPKI